jgi:hypothetical protein
MASHGSNASSAQNGGADAKKGRQRPATERAANGLKDIRHADSYNIFSRPNYGGGVGRESRRLDEAEARPPANRAQPRVES